MNTTVAKQRFALASLVLALHVMALICWMAMEQGKPPRKRFRQTSSITILLGPLVGQPTESVEQTKKLNQSTVSSKARETRKNVGTASVDLGTSPTDESMSLTTGADSSPDNMASLTPTLVLSLPARDLKALNSRGSGSRPILQGRPPKTLESQIAAAFGRKEPWVEERIDDNLFRYRRGNICVNAERSLAERLDPFSDASRRTPWSVGTPYTCQ